MVKIYYSDSRDQIFEWFDTDPFNYYTDSESIHIDSLIGEELMLLDYYGRTSVEKMIVPFGKNKGVTVQSLDDNYLRWLGSIARGPLAKWCSQEMFSRFGKILPPEQREKYKERYFSMDAIDMCMDDYGDSDDADDCNDFF